MIIVDFSQVMIANFMVLATRGGSGKVSIDLPLVRHMVLDSIRAINIKNKVRFGELVVAVDSPKSWRRDRYPQYKASRRKTRDEDEVIDWKLLRQHLRTIRDEIDENFPYRVVEVDGAEADDVIAVLAKKFAPREEVLVVSNDKDFIQLLATPNVTIYRSIDSSYVERSASSSGPLDALFGE